MAGPTTLRSINTSGIPTLSASRIRSYLFRLPLFTRFVLLASIVLWIVELQTMFNVVQWGSLIPKEVGLGSMYRLNTFPLVHLGFWHMLMDTLCLIPLLDRFEGEFGTLTSLALFMGPFGTIPGVVYIIVDRFIFRQNTAILGASIWVFLLLAAESIKTYRANPYFVLVSYKIPTWITPLLLVIVTSILLPNASLLGHLCGCAVGYLWGLGWIKFLAPPEKILRWIEGRLNLLGRLPHYVSVDSKTYGRYGVLPSTTPTSSTERSNSIDMRWLGDTPGQRLGPT